MMQRPFRRHPWWHHRTGWHTVSLAALACLLVIASVTSSAGASPQRAMLTAATTDGSAQGTCPTPSSGGPSTPSCFLFASSRHLDNPLGPMDVSKSDSYVGRRPTSDEKYTKVQWELWFDGKGQVRFHDLGTNRCLNVWQSNKRPWLDECHVSVPGDQSFAEDFYIRGVDNKAGYYRIVSARYPNMCLTEDGATQISDDDVTFKSCAEEDPDHVNTQVWGFSGVPNSNGSLPLGTDWMLPFVQRLGWEQCDADELTCLWTTTPGAKTNEADVPVIATTTCAGPVEYNWGTPAQPGAAALSYTTASSEEVASSQRETHSVAEKVWFKPLTPLAAFDIIPINPVQLSYGVTRSNFSEYSWARKHDVQHNGKIDAIPVGEWGWFTETTYRRHLSGTWTFARGTTTEFTAKFPNFNVPSFAPGTESGIIITSHTTVNPPDADCSNPVEDKPAVTAEQTLPAQLTASAEELVGMTFTTGAKRLEVSQLGRKRMTTCSGGAPTTGPVTVGLYQAILNGGGIQLIPGGAVTVKLGAAAAGAYAYTPLETKLILEANTKYYLLTRESPGGPCWIGTHSATINDKLGVSAPVPAEWAGSSGSEYPNNSGQAFESLNMIVSG
jgi:hypothetical protein